MVCLTVSLHSNNGDDDKLTTELLSVNNSEIKWLIRDF